MTQLVYTEEDLMRSHDYAKPHIVAGHRLHGGFNAGGTYIPPRALVREPAIDAWVEALRAQGGDILDADASLLGGLRHPSEAQKGKLSTKSLRLLSVPGTKQGSTVRPHQLPSSLWESSIGALATTGMVLE